MTDVAPLSPRTLGRTERRVPPVIWELGGGATALEVAERCTAARADWAVVPGSLSAESLRSLGPSLPTEWAVVLAVSGAALTSRAGNAVESRLDALGRQRCAAVMLQDVTADDLKAGRPFHRLSRLRDAGRVDLFLVDAPDRATAEWMVEHSPAHAIALPFGVGDLTARYNILPAAEEYGTGVFARRPSTAIWQPLQSYDAASDIAFCLSHPGVTAVVEPLPTDVAGVDRTLAAARASGVDVEDLWQAFQVQVPAPKKRRGGHPVDEA